MALAMRALGWSCLCFEYSCGAAWGLRAFTALHALNSFILHSCWKIYCYSGRKIPETCWSHECLTVTEGKLWLGIYAVSSLLSPTIEFRNKRTRIGMYTELISRENERVFSWKYCSAFADLKMRIEVSSQVNILKF